MTLMSGKAYNKLVKMYTDNNGGICLQKCEYINIYMFSHKPINICWMNSSQALLL